MKKIALITAILASLSACSLTQDPTGTGGATDSLPRSPCACEDTFYANGAWVG